VFVFLVGFSIALAFMPGIWCELWNWAFPKGIPLESPNSQCLD